MKYIILILLVLTNHSLYAIFDTDKESLQTSKRPPSQYSYSCLIFCGLDTYGTGSFIAPNIVVTARHVVTEWTGVDYFLDENPTLVNLNKIHIYKDQYTLFGIKVVGIEVLEKEDDIALLILDKDVESITPVTIVSDPNSQKINFTKTTFMGFGKGGILTDEDQSDVEAKLFYNGDIVFRFSTNDELQNQSTKNKLFPGNRVKMSDSNELSQDVYWTHIVLCSGDSGGAIIDEKGNLFAINKSAYQGGLNQFVNEGRESMKNNINNIGWRKKACQHYSTLDDILPSWIMNRIDNLIYEKLYKIFNDQCKLQYSLLVDSFNKELSSDIIFKNLIIDNKALLIKLKDFYEQTKIDYNKLLVRQNEELSSLNSNDYKENVEFFINQLEYINKIIEKNEKSLLDLYNVLNNSKLYCFGNNYTFITPYIKEWITRVINENKLI